MAAKTFNLQLSKFPYVLGQKLEFAARKYKMSRNRYIQLVCQEAVDRILSVEASRIIELSTKQNLL